MRDMLSKKFERCVRAQGFDPVPKGLVFISHDGLQVQAVMAGSAMAGTTSRIDRRATLQRMVAARKAVTPVNEEAAGVSAPAASCPQPGLGE